MKLSKLRHATATRHLAGVNIPRQDMTSFGMRAALKKGGSRYAGEAGDVEGKAARPRLDRPGRKAGGRVCDEMDAHKWGGRAHAKPKMDDHDEDDKYAKGGFLAGMKKGALHREMGVPEGDKIPEKKLEKAEHSDNPKLRKRAILAQTMKHWKHKG